MECAINEEKLKTLIAYMAQQTSPGKLKLFKLLYLTDFTAHTVIGRSITGLSYENFQLGPVPRFLWDNFYSITRDCVTVEQCDYNGRIAYEIHAHRPVSLQIFDEDEKVIVVDVASKYGNKTGAELTRLTHAELPFKATCRGEQIPYYLAPFRDFKRISRAEVTSLIDKNQKLAERLRQGLRRGAEEALEASVE